MSSYKKLVAEAAEKYADWHVDLSDPDTDEESMKEHAFCSNHCASVLKSPACKELIEQVAREACTNLKLFHTERPNIFGDYTPWVDRVFNDEYWAKFMGGEDE